MFEIFRIKNSKIKPFEMSENNLKKMNDFLIRMKADPSKKNM
jgi:hypothetical protein